MVHEDRRASMLCLGGGAQINKKTFVGKQAMLKVGQ